jgi:hypothetical protein
MVMIIFSLLEFFNVKVTLFFYFFDPFVFFSWFLVMDLFIGVCCFFCLSFFPSLFFCWGNLGYFSGCDFISYGLILDSCTEHFSNPVQDNQQTLKGVLTLTAPLSICWISCTSNSGCEVITNT